MSRKANLSIAYILFHYFSTLHPQDFESNIRILIEDDAKLVFRLPFFDLDERKLNLLLEIYTERNSFFFRNSSFSFDVFVRPKFL